MEMWAGVGGRIIKVNKECKALIALLCGLVRLLRGGGRKGKCIAKNQNHLSPVGYELSHRHFLEGFLQAALCAPCSKSVGEMKACD